MSSVSVREYICGCVCLCACVHVHMCACFEQGLSVPATDSGSANESKYDLPTNVSGVTPSAQQDMQTRSAHARQDAWVFGILVRGSPREDASHLPVQRGQVPLR